MIGRRFGPARGQQARARQRPGQGGATLEKLAAIGSAHQARTTPDTAPGIVHLMTVAHGGRADRT